MKRADLIVGRWYQVRHRGASGTVHSRYCRIENLRGKMPNQVVVVYFGERPKYNVNLQDIVRPHHA